MKNEESTLQTHPSHQNVHAHKKAWLHPWLFWGIFVTLIALDQLVKAWARNTLIEFQAPGFPWPGVFEIKLTYNTGIAFGKFQGAGMLFTPIALAVTILSILFSLRNPKLGNLVHVSLGMLAAGAIGNLIDRLWLHKVTAMFWFRLIDFPVFNVADACITVAAILLLFQFFIMEGRSKKEEGDHRSSAEPS
jgi:signal peptidase II